MDLAFLLALAAGTFLAFANGANDVSKGIATLVGSGVSSYRRAILWGAAWALAGGIASSFVATAMIATFGKGLLAPGTTPTTAAAIAVIAGATCWVMLATRTGLPVSTTHAIVGSLAGVSLVAYGAHALEWSHLAAKIVVPLVVSPIVAFSATWGVLRLTKTRAAPPADCICVEAVPQLATSTSAALSARLEVAVGTSEACAIERPAAARASLDHAHWLTSGATSFARAMNDVPKMVAIMAAAIVARGETPNRSLVFASVTTGMIVGSLVGGRRVTRLLAEKVTPMNHREGFHANLVTSALVVLGAAFGLPMSTTHVSSSAILAAGVERGAGTVDRKTLRDMALAWVLTLPGAALLGCIAYFVARALSHA